MVGVVRQPGEGVGLQVVVCVVPQRVLGAAGRGVALEALGVGEELAGRLGAADKQTKRGRCWCTARLLNHLFSGLQGGTLRFFVTR